MDAAAAAALHPAEMPQQLGDDAAAAVVERKPGRKRKLPEEQLEQPLGHDLVVVVKTEHEELAELASGPSGGDGKRMRRSVRLGNRHTADGATWEEVKTEPQALLPPPGELSLTEVTSVLVPPLCLTRRRRPRSGDARRRFSQVRSWSRAPHPPPQPPLALSTLSPMGATRTRPRERRCSCRSARSAGSSPRRRSWRTMSCAASSRRSTSSG